MRCSITLCGALTAAALWVTSAPAGEQPGGGEPIPVEFSNHLDRMSNGTGGLGDLDPAQMLYTEPDDLPGGRPVDGVDFNQPFDVDAAAAQYDYLFDVIVDGLAELLVSFVGDEVVACDSLGLPVFSETWIEQCKWTKLQLVNTTGADSLRDLDALETHGLLGLFDVKMYSLAGDASGVSVYFFNGVSSSAFVTRAQIFAAVAALGFAGVEADIDLDAMMVKDADEDGIWDTGDEILFSIDEAANFHGGELIVLPFGGTPTFLFHGGHLWDTSFDPIIAFGTKKKNVDAVDAGSGETGNIPTLSEWAMIVMLLLLLAAGFVVLRRPRRERV